MLTKTKNMSWKSFVSISKNHLSSLYRNIETSLDPKQTNEKSRHFRAATRAEGFEDSKDRCSPKGLT